MASSRGHDSSKGTPAGRTSPDPRPATPKVTDKHRRLPLALAPTPTENPLTSGHDADTDTFLRAAGLRRTPVRVGVVEVLTSAGRPLSVPQLLGKLRNVDSVTVYRTLNTFVEKGLVHRIRSEDRSWLYAIGPAQKLAEHKHPHFVCESCGKVECVEGASIPENFLATLHVPPTYTISYPEVVLHGTCPTCR